MKIYENEEYFNSIENCANIICEYLGGKKIESDEILEIVFKSLKNVAQRQEHLNTSEYNYWNESGLIKCNSFDEVLRMMEHKSKD